MKTALASKNGSACIFKEVHEGTKRQVVEYTFTGDCGLVYPSTLCPIHIRVYEQSSLRAHSYSIFLAFYPALRVQFRPVSSTWLREHLPAVLAFIKDDLGVRKYKGV